MTATLLPLPGPESTPRRRRTEDLPDPRPAAASSFRELIDHGHLTYEEIAAAALETMGVTISVDVIGRWHDGLGFPPSYVWLLVLWLSPVGMEVVSSLGF